MTLRTKANAGRLALTPPSEKRAAAARASEVRDLSGNKPARLTIDLPRLAHRALKLRAVQRGQSIRDYMIELLKGDGVEW